MTKKILSVFLAALMVFSMVPFAGLTAFAGDMPVPHTHAFEYTATGATLTATCTDGCDKSYDTTPLTLTLTEDGFDETALNTWKDAGATEPVITYYAANDTELTTPIDKPTEPGKYKVQAVVDSKTAELAFSIADPANITWDYDEGTKTLTLGNAGGANNLSDAGWSDKEVDKVVVASPIAPVSMASWFKGVKEFTGLDKIITDNVTDMTGLFEGSTVSELDISAWNISQDCVVDDMFKDCTNLEKFTSPCAAVEIELPAVPTGKAWELNGGVHTSFALNTSGKVYSIMSIDADKPYFTLTYQSDVQTVEKKIAYNTTDKAYTVKLLSPNEAQAFAPNSLYTFSKWKDENGNKYNAGKKITLTGDMTVYPVWNSAILVKDDGQYTIPATKDTDYTLKDGVLTILENNVCVGGMLENTVIKTAEDVNELAFMTLTAENKNVTAPMISVDDAEKKFTLTLIGESTVNLAEGQSFIDDGDIELIINRLPQMGATGTLNINTDNATALLADIIAVGDEGTENSLTVNITDKAAESSKSAIEGIHTISLFNSSLNVERTAAEGAPAAVKAHTLYIGTGDNAAKMNVTENGEAVAIDLNFLTAGSGSELTVRSAKASAVKAVYASFYVDTKIDIRSEESYAAELSGTLTIEGKAQNKDVKITFATGSETVSAVKVALGIDITAKALPESADVSFDFYSGFEKLTLDKDDELATEGGDKAAVAKLNTGGFVVMFKCGDEILEDKDIQVNGGDFITPPEGYRFTGESEKYYYTPITEKTWVTVAEAEEGVPSIPEKIPDYYIYVESDSDSGHEGYMSLRTEETKTDPYDYTYVTNEYFITKTTVDEYKNPEKPEEKTGSHFEYVKKPVNELHELSGYYLIVGNDVQLTDLVSVLNKEGVRNANTTLILAEGAHVTVKGSDATDEEPAKPAILFDNAEVYSYLYVCGTDNKRNYDASLTLIGGDGSEAFPTGASGLKMPQRDFGYTSTYGQSAGNVNIKAGKSVGGSEGNFAMQASDICIGNGTLTATGTPGETESAGINAYYLQAGYFATLNVYGAKGKIPSRGIVSWFVYFTNNYRMKNKSEVTVNVEGSGNAYAIEASQIIRFEGEVRFSAVGGNGTTTGALSDTPLFDDPYVSTYKNTAGGYSDFDLAECFAGATPGCQYINGVHSFVYADYGEKIKPSFPITAKYMSFKTVHHSFMFRTRSSYNEGGELDKIAIEAHCINCAIPYTDTLDDYVFEGHKPLSQSGQIFYDREAAEYAAANYSNVYCLNCPGCVTYSLSSPNIDKFDGKEKDVKATLTIEAEHGDSRRSKLIVRDSIIEPKAALEQWNSIIGKPCFGLGGVVDGPKVVYSSSEPDEPLSGNKKPYYPNQKADGHYDAYLQLAYKPAPSSSAKTIKTKESVEFRIAKVNLTLAPPDLTAYMDQDGDITDAIDPKTFIKVDSKKTPGYDVKMPNPDEYKPALKDEDITCTVIEGTDCVEIKDGVLIPLKTGTAKLHFVINETKCYFANEVDYTVTVKKRPVEFPSISTVYKYENGIGSAPLSAVQVLNDESAKELEGFNSDLISIDGNVIASEVGTVPVTLKLKDTVHYCWAGDETEAEETTTINWTITKVDAPAYFTREVSGDNIVIPNRAGRTKSFDLPEKVPVKPEGEAYAATTFTAGDCSLNKVTGAIADNKLQLTVGENHIVSTDGNTFTAEVKVSSNNFNDYTVEYTVTPIYHTHSYVSDTVEDNNRALNVSCNSTTDFGCFCGNQPITIEIDYPEHAVGESHNFYYTSYPILCQCYADDWEAGYEDTATNYIKYYEELKDGSYVEMTEGQPTIVGTYKAELSIGGKSVEVVYNIIPANVVINDNEPPTATVTYGDAVTNDVIEGSMKSAVNGIDVEATKTSFVWNSNEGYGDAGTKERFAKFTPKDTHNFNVNDEVAVTLMVNKANATEEMKAASLGSINNRKGSTVTVDLSSLNPAGGATFSNATAPEGISALVSGSELSLEITGSHLTTTSFIVNVSVTDAKNYNPYTIDVSVNVLFHTHTFAESDYKTENNAIVATCSSEEQFPCYLASENGTEGNTLMLTLNDNPDGKGSCEVSYTGYPIIFSLNAAQAAFWKAETNEDPNTVAIEYTAKDGSMLKDGMAVDVGSYTASYTFHGQTITKDFTIVMSEVVYYTDDTAPTATVTYGDAVSASDIGGTMRNSVTGDPVKGTFAWNNNPETYGDAQSTAKVFKATFTPDDTDNYYVNNDVSVNVTVNKDDATNEMKAASLNSINNRVGSKAELDLKDKLPKGAEFGIPTVQNDIATASINDNKLSLEIIGSHAAIEQFTVEVPVNHATNYNPYNIIVTVDVLFHTHSFAYSTDTVKNAIVATCNSTSEFNCYLASENKTEGNILMLTLNAMPDNKESTTVVYTGEPVKFSLNADQAALWKLETGEDPTLTKVTYTAKAGSLLNENGEAVDAGSYTANYTLHEKTISIDFTIIKADVEVKELQDVTVAYGTEPLDSDIKGKMRSTETKNPVSGTFTWNGLETYGDAQTEKKSFTATFTPDDTKNFNTKNDIDVNVKVNKADKTDTASCKINNRKGSTAELDLKDKLPKGAEFGIPTVQNDIATASINDNKLSLEIIGSHAAIEQFTVEVPVNHATNYKDYDIEVTVDVLFHTHSFAYSTDTVKNAIVATCNSTSEFDCYLASENKTEGNILMLTLNAMPDGKESTTVVYTGEPVTFSLNAEEVALWKTETDEDPTLTPVTYTAKSGSTTGGKAVEAGSYTASYTLHEKTISIDFTIIKADVEVIELKDVTVTYGTAVSNDVIKGTMKSAKTGKPVSGKFTWNSLETYGDAQDDMKSFTATFTPDDAKNFNTKNDITVKVKVNKTAATEEMKAAESRILNKAGSTAELDLTDMLPTGAKFGTVTVVSEGIATASVVDNVLKLKIAETDLTEDNDPFDVEVAVKDATNYVDYEIIVTVDVYFHVHEFDTAYTYDENNHWHRCIEENCYIEDYSTCGLEEVAYGEHIGMEDYICDVCGYENIPACKEAAIALVKASLPRNTNHKQQEIADKAIADIENAERVASINEITAKAVDDVAKNAIRCPLCDRYEEEKDIQFYGFILSIVHLFVHLAYSINRMT